MPRSVELNIKGIKCDASGCDYTDPEALFDHAEEYLRKPCPRCGAPLLTVEDLAAITLLRAITNAANVIAGPAPDGAKYVHAAMKMNGSGNVEIGDIKLDA